MKLEWGQAKPDWAKFVILVLEIFIFIIELLTIKL
jgi:hypothetical protein